MNRPCRFFDGGYRPGLYDENLTVLFGPFYVLGEIIVGFQLFAEFGNGGDISIGNLLAGLLFRGKDDLDIRVISLTAGILDQLLLLFEDFFI